MAPEPAPPPAPPVADNGPLRSSVVVFHNDDDNGGPCDSADEEEEAVRQDSGGASAAAAAAAAGGLGLQLQQMLCTGVSTRQEEVPSPPAPFDPGETGRTYDGFTKSPPPHIRCVVSPASSLPPALSGAVSGAQPRHYRVFVADVPGLRRVKAVLFV